MIYLRFYRIISSGSNSKYQILKGDSIFEIIKRSGGLSDDAYLKGLVFSRIKEQKRKDKPLKDLKGN